MQAWMDIKCLLTTFLASLARCSSPLCRRFLSSPSRTHHNHISPDFKELIRLSQYKTLLIKETTGIYCIHI
ncbi:hypothetical protein Hanom_Chr08g00714601 [Helianthus anomalus]